MSVAQLDLTVVIRTGSEERWDDLLAAVDSVRHQETPPRELVLVVDHNPPLQRRARTHLDGVKVIENHEPQGASGALNSGIAAAEGRLVAFLDDDAVAAPDWLTWLGRAFDRSDAVGVGGLIEPLWSAGRPRWFPEEFDWVVGCVYRGGFGESGPVRNLIGANMAFRREVFELVGRFRNGVGASPGRFLRCEDTEFCIRLRRRIPGAVLLYEPRARVQHRVGLRRSSWRYFRARCYAEGLSKAVIAGFVGAGDGLASERSYAFRTLPAGVLRDLGDVLLRRDVSGATRAGSIVVGFAYTTAGYVIGRAAPGVVGLPARRSLEPLPAGGA